MFIFWWSQEISTTISTRWNRRIAWRTKVKLLRTRRRKCWWMWISTKFQTSRIHMVQNSKGLLWISLCFDSASAPEMSYNEKYVRGFPHFWKLSTLKISWLLAGYQILVLFKSVIWCNSIPCLFPRFLLLSMFLIIGTKHAVVWSSWESRVT